MEREKDLINRLKKGDKRAFEKIYGLYASEILIFVGRHLDCEEDVEEVVQDIFVALWNARNNIRAEFSLRSLLYRSARNRIINCYRSRISVECCLDELREGEVSSIHSTETDIEYNEFRRRVISAVLALPLTQRKIVILSRYRGLSHRQIVEQTGFSLQTVKNNLSQALKKLREVLDVRSFSVGLLILTASQVHF